MIIWPSLKLSISAVLIAAQSHGFQTGNSPLHLCEGNKSELEDFAWRSSFTDQIIDNDPDRQILLN